MIFNHFPFSIFGDEEPGNVSTILQQERERQMNFNPISQHDTNSNGFDELNRTIDNNMNQDSFNDSPEWLQHWRITQEAERERLQQLDASHPGASPPEPPTRPPKRPELRTEVNIFIDFLLSIVCNNNSSEN